MSNSIHFVQTEFKSLHGYTTYGYRAYDDYTSAYNNCWDDLYDEPLDFLEALIDEYNDNEASEEVKGLLDHIKEHKCGFHLDDDYYEFEEVKELFDSLGD